jgi:hypothetical protein
MATRLPPPKRVKVYHGVPEPEPEPVKPSPNIIVQFVSEDDGRALAPAINLPANTSREGLEAVLNRLSTQVCVCGYVIHNLTISRMKIQYRFHSMSLCLKQR